MPKSLAAIVLAGNGTNCEIETAHACRLAGFETVDIVPLWELLSGEVSLARYDLLNLPGGFLDGDDLGSAKAQANRFLHTTIPPVGDALLDHVTRFIRSGKLILGICNGFQLLIKLGLLPAFDEHYAVQVATLSFNDSGRFEDRWVHLRVNAASPCAFTKNLDSLYLPVRHGEGKFIARDNDVLERIKSGNHIALSYCEPASPSPTIKYPDNPNGSQLGIAGICDETGRVFGLMPHPEGYLHRTNHPRWTREELPETGMGLAIFTNAYHYLRG